MSIDKRVAQQLPLGADELKLRTGEGCAATPEGADERGTRGREARFDSKRSSLGLS